MSRHTTYRGTTIDMDSIRRENEKTPALGNMQVNAKGDQIRGGAVVKSADQIARENHRVTSTITHTGLKGDVPDSPESALPKPVQKTTATPKKQKESELPNGDIIVGDSE